MKYDLLKQVMEIFAVYSEEDIKETLSMMMSESDLLGKEREQIIDYTLYKVNEFKKKQKKNNFVSYTEIGEVYFRKKDYTIEPWNSGKIEAAIMKSDERATKHIKDSELVEVLILIENRISQLDSNIVNYKDVHAIVEEILTEKVPEIGTCYKEYRSISLKWAKIMDNILRKSSKLMFLGDKSNANADSSLASTISCIMAGYLGKEMYMMQFLSAEEREAVSEGFIYPHDMDKRYLYPLNCCLFNVWDLLKGIRRDRYGNIIEIRGGFEMANVWYNTPKTIDVAFDVIGDIVLSAASQQYGGFTISMVDTYLSEYAEKTYHTYYTAVYDEKIEAVNCTGIEVSKEIADNLRAQAAKSAMEKLEHDIMQGFQGWEYKFNTVASSRGDYPFITVSGGLATDRFGKLIWKCAMRNHSNGQGKKGHKKATLFPKYVFLYDKNLHGEGRLCEDVFLEGIKCSQKTMYPDWLSLTGEGYVPEMYKKYKMVISPMGCRAFLSPYYINGGLKPADENDIPVFLGRFNIGAISLNLPLIFKDAEIKGIPFKVHLTKYLSMVRGIHKRTYDFIAKMPASRNPLALCEGGLYGGNLSYDAVIGDNPVILEAATASFGITALNELNQLAVQKSITDDNSFVIDIMNFIEEKLNDFKKEDGHLYAIYGTPAESLCGRQVEQFREMFGIIPNVSDKEFVTNSFHCPVWEDLDPFEKQDKEKELWHLFNGGKIQYVKYPVSYNTEAYISLIRRAMEYGFYEGCNTSISYCEDCGENHVNLKGDICPKCGSANLTKIDRMNGYLSYSRVKGDTRLNEAKMAEIAIRKSM